MSWVRFIESHPPCVNSRFVIASRYRGLIIWKEQRIVDDDCRLSSYKAPVLPVRTKAGTTLDRVRSVNRQSPNVSPAINSDALSSDKVRLNEAHHRFCDFVFSTPAA